MKIIRYKFLSEETLIDKVFRCPADKLTVNEETARREAYNGEYTVEDDGIEEVSEPTQLDRVEAQVTYTAMMTDTLLEV